MPIFEYACQKCDHRFEKIVNGSAAPACPACGGRRLERQLSVFAVAAKTTGTAPKAGDFRPGACGSCGDPRGPGSCAPD